MNGMIGALTVGKMHGWLDSEVNFYGQKYVETKQQKHFIVQERDVRYVVTTHYHHYVKSLIDGLLVRGTAGLEDADTQYVSGAASLPESVQVMLAPNAVVGLPQNARLTAGVDAAVTLDDNTPFPLARGMGLTLNAALNAAAPNGVRATLVNGMQPTPEPGAPLTLPAQAAFVSADTFFSLPANTGVTLYNGRKGKLNANTLAYLDSGSGINLAANTAATLRKSKPRPVLYQQVLDRYQPSDLVLRPYAARDLDFGTGGAYAVYNWEVFFHAPLTMALHLSKNQRFAEAQRWFHYIFDPTDDSDGPTPQRFWKVRPFQTTDVKKVEDILVNLATGEDRELLAQTAQSMAAWERDPFRPHVVAEYRQQAYMYKTVMAYLDNLIAWGDSLFAQDSPEAVDEALMIYALAANILGPRPQAVPAKGTVKPQTYASLRKDLKKFGVVLQDVEAEAPFDLMPLPADGSGTSSQTGAVRSLGKALYFCVPRNDRLIGYWDTVADRLFKIRNSLNLQGVFRQLPLFAPPLDPGMLARAAAAGLDVAGVVNGLNQPLPLVRFPLLAQKALEVAQEVKSLGANLLAAMEKEDGEALALLRSKHERAVLDMVEHVKYAQWQEAIKAREGLEASLQVAVARYVYYERQLGRDENQIKEQLPELVTLDRSALEKQNLATQEPTVEPRNIDVDIASGALADAAGFLSGGKLLSSYEVTETLLMEAAQIAIDAANILSSFGTAAAIVPQFEVSAEPWGMGGATSFGGQNVGAGIQAGATVTRGIAERLNFEARRAQRIDGFARREREWAFQSNQAAGDITQIFKQLRAAELREAIAELELKNHREQKKQAEEIERFLNGDGTNKTGKRTNKALYTWMKREVKGLYAQAFQLAFDIARKAERALQHELGDPNLTFLQFGYLAGKEGLLAGERLFMDVKRMELAHLDLNRREYELTKHVSLAQIDPAALIELRATGRCELKLTEDLFNLDGPSHYFRRIKNVAVTVPCVTGPYASVNCTLTLTKSAIRTTPVVGDGYPEANSEDSRFSRYYGSMQSIVTSSAQNDGGLFDTNLRDERYLPFEGSGVISEWRLQMPGNPAAGDPTQFDYNTISDVVLHIRYTAREGGDALGKPAVADLKEKLENSRGLGSIRLLSLRHDFPVAWAAFKAAQPQAGFRPLEIKLAAQHFPWWSQGAQGEAPTVTDVEMIAISPNRVQVEGEAAPLGAWLGGNLKRGKVEAAAKPAVDTPWKVKLDADGIEEAWLLLKWTRAA